MASAEESQSVAGGLPNALRSVLVLDGPDPFLLGIMPVRLLSGTRAAVKVSRPPKIVHEKAGIEWELKDQWVAEVWHLDQKADVLDSAAGARTLLDESIEALNIAVQWLKVRDLADRQDRIVPWIRRFGRIDVRASIHWDQNDHVAFFVNPHKPFPPELYSLLPIGNMVMTNGPLAQPTAGLTDRFAASLDLLNHGFATEALLIAFSTFEGWLRDTLDAVLFPVQPGEEREELSSRIRNARFRQCLTTLPEEARWASLEQASAEVYAALLDVYKTRNALMHNAANLTRDQAELCIEVVAQATLWLQSQAPHAVPDLPPSNVAVPGFFKWHPGDPPLKKNIGSQSDEHDEASSRAEAKPDGG